MASIKVSDLHSAGAELFQDSESFLNELTEQEIGNTLGGWYAHLAWSLICVGG